MKYKVGDRVRIKSLDWYNENKDEYGQVECGQWNFTKWYTPYCGKVMTIRFKWKDDECYKMFDSDHHWTDEMIECKVGQVEGENVLNKWTGLKVELELSKSVIGVSNVESLRGERFMSGFVKAIIPPDGYQFTDENGNVINATKIVLEKKSPKTDDVIKWLKEHDMTKYIGVLCSGICSITFDTDKLIKDINETIGD